MDSSAATISNVQTRLIDVLENSTDRPREEQKRLLAELLLEAFDARRDS